MFVSGLTMINYRNYKEETIAFSPGVNVLMGENAQGKTNLLEALHYLSCARSLRGVRDRELIRGGEACAAIRATVCHSDREFLLEARLFEGARRQIWINGIRQSGASCLSGILNTVVFTPDDLYLVRDGAAVRRRFLDFAISQLRVRYQSALSEYSRLYEHKTRILRDAGDNPSLLEALDVFSQRMAHFGAVLIHYRQAFVKKLKPLAQAAHGEISGGRERLDIVYKTVSTVADTEAPVKELSALLLARMMQLRTAEIDARSCLTGPHKDDLLLSINEMPVRTHGSQGQTRTVALSLKLAERQIFMEDTGQYPVLLLDDVLSELDGRRRDFVLNRIEGGQVMITCCGPDTLRKDGRTFRIEDGRVTGFCEAQA